MSKPVRLRASSLGDRSTLSLYDDKLVEALPWPRKAREFPLAGVEANVSHAGMHMRGLTLGNTAYLSIVGPGVAITRTLNGRGNIKRGVQFAAEVNARAHASV